MTQIYLAMNFIAASEVTGETDPETPSTGLENSGHLQFVKFDSSGEPQEIEVQANLIGNWVYEGPRKHHGTENTQYISDEGIIPDDGKYKKILLPLSESQTAEQFWELLLQVHSSLIEHGSGIDYDTLSAASAQNSNTYVNSLLATLGIELSGSLLSSVTPTDVDNVPGVTKDIFLDGAKVNPINSNQPIALELSGTDGNDYIVYRVSTYETAGNVLLS